VPFWCCSSSRGALHVFECCHGCVVRSWHQLLCVCAVQVLQIQFNKCRCGDAQILQHPGCFQNVQACSRSVMWSHLGMLHVCLSSQCHSGTLLIIPLCCCRRQWMQATASSCLPTTCCCATPPAVAFCLLGCCRMHQMQATTVQSQLFYTSSPAWLLQAAPDAGHSFSISSNGVLLCEAPCVLRKSLCLLVTKCPLCCCRMPWRQATANSCSQTTS
jgi:hypothetical protein